MFIDEAVVTVKAGDGGNGAATFRREKCVQFGGPDGGDGGHGGDIIFIADNNINTLIDFKSQKMFKAENGTNGEKKRMHGKTGENFVIKVPLGTMIRDFETGTLLMDLNEIGIERVFLKGGRGGNGNVHFKSSIRKTPNIAEKGKKGKELKIKLELKLLADVALVGYPSVGKSSFINKVSAAHSKVASYHFTTLNPKLGVVSLEEEKSFVIADIPGLIEGAHQGVGLGDKFLKHIERCKMIYHIVDIAGSEGRNPIDDYEAINKELKNYSEKLYNKKQIVIANKMDLLYEDKNFEEFKEYLNEKSIELYPVSVLLNRGIKDILYKTYDVLQNTEREVLEEEAEIDTFFNSKEYKKDWIIEKIEEEDGIVFEVKGAIPENVINTYIINNEDMLTSVIHILKNLGLEKELRKNGVEAFDTIRIDKYEFEFVE